MAHLLAKPRSPMRSVSAKRQAQNRLRKKVRDEVLTRDQGCRARTLAPGPCRSPFRDRKPLEVHELIGGAYRSECWLDPDLCISVCQVHHDWIEAHPAAAEELGLARPSSDLTGTSDPD